MKRFFIVFCLVLFITGLAAAQVRTGGTLFVSTNTLDLKTGTGFFAANRGTLNYGDRVTVLQVNGRFVEIRSAENASLSGWAPSANLSARQVVGGTGSTATASEIAMAGKGFNQELEASYRARGNLHYAELDRIEAITINGAALRQFLEEGRLRLGDN